MATLTTQQNGHTYFRQTPLYMMVLTGGLTAYRRSDGVYVIPLGCLKP
ncbi:MAG: hypothetical protein K6E86_08820 [Bacteroidales bacterium]|nr:hypothetical protein [Bacteroidales bacterium]